jgi:outer membrane protein
MKILYLFFPFCFLLNPTKPLYAQNSGKMSLRQCIEVALAANISMKQGQATIQSNTVALNQSKMNRLPSLNGGGSQSLNFGRSVNPYDNTVVENQQVNSNNFSLSANLNVFNGFQNTYTLQQRQMNLRASEHDLGTTRNSIVLGVVESYASVLSTQALLQSAQAQAEGTRAQIDRTEKLVRAGSLPETNLLDLKAQLATEETNIVLNENNLDLARLQLAQWMQTEPSRVMDLEEPAFVPGEGKDQTAFEVFSVAEPNQPQIKAAQMRVLSADKGIAIARSAFYPSLSLQAGLFTNYSSIAQRFIPGKTLDTPVYQPFDAFQITDLNGNEIPIKVNQVIRTSEGGFQSLSFSDQFDNNLRKGISFNLNIPIFNGFQARYGTETARINKISAQLELERQRNQLRQTIETAVANEKAARKRLEAVERQISALTEAYRSSEQRFNLGVMNSVDFLLAKNNLARAENDKARFRYDFFIRRALIDFYLGKDLFDNATK